MNITKEEIQKIELDCDKEQAIRNVSVYSLSTGISCRIIDAKGKTVYESCSNACGFCSNQNNAINKKFNCSDVHLYGSYQAERFGGCYIFFCPLGFTHWASPITSNGTIIGALIGGPVMMVEPDEFMIDDLYGKNNLFDLQKIEIFEQIKNMPVIKPEIVNNLAELLLIVASQLSKGNSLLAEQAEKNRLQDRISENVHIIKNIETCDSQVSHYPFEKERNLSTAISLGDKPASQKILNEILGYIYFSSGRNFEIIKARIQELIVLLSRAAIEGGADFEEIFGLNCHYLIEISNYKNIEDLTFWLSKILARFTDCVFNLVSVRHKDVIYKAIDYIKKNYMRKITLEEVADYVYLNPSYFSKVFKNEMGTSFISYINKLRVEVSKTILFDLSVSLTDVSSLVGFDEQCYFTKVFKKIAGVTPGYYRKSMGGQKSEVK